MVRMGDVPVVNQSLSIDFMTFISPL